MLVPSHTGGEGTATNMNWSWNDTDPVENIEDLAADTLLDFIARLAGTGDEEGYFSREIEMNLVWREADAQVAFARKGRETEEISKRLYAARDHVYQAHYLVGSRQGVEAAKKIQDVIRTLYGTEAEKN
jgi:hypothetical protein